MRRLRSTLTAFVATYALGAVSASSGLAAAPEFSPVPAKKKFTITSEAIKLVTLNKEEMACKADTGKGEFTGARTLLEEVDFTGCTALGIFSANSLGDSSGVILVKLSGELCFISEAKLEVGIYLAILGSPPDPENGKVHIEVPSVGALSVLLGSIIGKIGQDGIKTKAFTLTLKEKAAGDPEWTTCSGKAGTQTYGKNEGEPAMSAMTSTEPMVAEEETTITG